MIPVFRAWHKETKKMCPVYGFAHLRVPYSQLIEIQVPKWLDDSGMYFRDRLFCKLDEIELMQWTGFRSEEKIDIYEGDILYFIAAYGAESIIIERESAAVLHARDLYGHENEDLRDLNLEFWTIAGNIYENSELLEQK